MARVPDPLLPSVDTPLVGRHLKGFLDWVKSLLLDKPDKRLRIRVISSTHYTLTQYDAGAYLRFTGACVVTVPKAGSVPLAPGSSVRGSFASGDVVHLRSHGTQIQVVEATGVTVNVPVDALEYTRGGRCSAMLVCVASGEALKNESGSVVVVPNTWDLLGDLEPGP
jgi:hypothetical protein